MTLELQTDSNTLLLLAKNKCFLLIIKQDNHKNFKKLNFLRFYFGQKILFYFIAEQRQKQLHASTSFINPYIDKNIHYLKFSLARYNRKIVIPMIPGIT